MITCLICFNKINQNNAHSVENKIINPLTILQGIEELISCQYSDQIVNSQYVCKQCFKLLKMSLNFRRLVLSSKKHFNKYKIIEVYNNNNDCKLNTTNDTKDKILQSVCNENVLEQDLKDTEIVKKSLLNECKYCGIEIKHFTVHTCKHKKLIYSCALCPKKFSRKEYLTVHNRTHTGEKPYHCDICKKDFSQQASFYVHKRRLHDKVVLGTCNYCGKKFVDKSALDNHIKMWHTGERSYLCEICSATFVCNRTLQRHQKELHNQKKPCQKCGKMLGDYALKKHLYRHKVQEGGAEISRKRYTCEYCNIIMNFTSRRRHLEKKHGIKLLGRGNDCMKMPLEIKNKKSRDI